MSIGPTLDKQCASSMRSVLLRARMLLTTSKYFHQTVSDRILWWLIRQRAQEPDDIALEVRARLSLADALERDDQSQRHNTYEDPVPAAF